MGKTGYLINGVGKAGQIYTKIKNKIRPPSYTIDKNKPKIE